MASERWDTLFGKKLFLFGGRFREFEGGKVWDVAKTIVFVSQNAYYKRSKLICILS